MRRNYNERGVAMANRGPTRPELAGSLRAPAATVPPVRPTAGMVRFRWPLTGDRAALAADRAECRSRVILTAAHRYEFDCDDRFIYVYSAVRGADGTMTGRYLPVRRFAR